MEAQLNEGGAIRHLLSPDFEKHGWFQIDLHQDVLEQCYFLQKTAVGGALSTSGAAHVRTWVEGLGAALAPHVLTTQANAVYLQDSCSARGGEEGEEGRVCEEGEEGQVCEEGEEGRAGEREEGDTAVSTASGL